MVQLAYFLKTCFWARLSIALVPLFTKGNRVLQTSVAILFLLFSMFFLYAIFFRSSPQKGFFGGRVWWKAHRPKHAAAYAFASLLMLGGRPVMASIVLGVDLASGVMKAFEEEEEEKKNENL